MRVFARIFGQKTAQKPIPVTRWAQWWGRNALEQPWDRGYASLLACALVALLSESVEELERAIAAVVHGPAKLPESHRQLLQTALDELVATRQTGQTPWEHLAKQFAAHGRPLWSTTSLAQARSELLHGKFDLIDAFVQIDAEITPKTGRPPPKA